MTVAPASQLPEMTGVVVASSAPVTGEEIVEAAGATVSTVTARPALVALTLPAASVWREVSVWLPWLNAALVQLKVEAAQALEHSSVAPS